jgi:hypothetical protein
MSVRLRARAGIDRPCSTLVRPPIAETSIGQVWELSAYAGSEKTVVSYACF